MLVARSGFGEAGIRYSSFRVQCSTQSVKSPANHCADPPSIVASFLMGEWKVETADLIAHRLLLRKETGPRGRFEFISS